MEPFDRKRYSPAYLKRLETDVFQEANKLTIAKLEQLIHDASYAYYNSDRSLISDSAFDTLIDLLKQKKPDSAVLDTIGAELPVDAPNKVALPYHLGSMDKIKPGSRDLELWLSRYNKGPYTISEKLDGLSGLLVLKVLPDGSGLERHLYRRGDSDMAQEVSHLLDYINYLNTGNGKLQALMQYINKLPSKTLAVRGEIIIKKSVFAAKYQDRYPKTRSLINGVALSKPENFSRPELQATARDVEYVVYAVMDPTSLTHIQQFTLASKLGFNIASAESIPGPLTVDILKTKLLDYKASSQYDIDGIIIADDSRIYELPKTGNPKYAVAFKMMLDEQTQVTTVVRVEWNITKNKLLKPRVEFEPVKIGGDTIMFATGFNAKFIADNGIGPGARIKIVRSGDVIPYIAQVITPAPDWAKPTIAWKWVEGSQIDIQPVDMAHAPDFLNKQLLHFFTTMGVDGIRAGTLDKLIGAGFDSINLILDLEVANLLDVAGFQITSATKLVNNIKEFVLDKPHPLEVLMTASNLFPGFGIKKLEPLVTQLGISKILTNTITKSAVLSVPGFSDVSASKFQDILPDFIAWLAEHPRLRVAVPKTVTKVTTAAKQTPVTGKIIVFTGFRDKDMADKLTGMGATIADSITSSTNIIVAKDPDASSSKLDKARERGIPIMDILAFKVFAGL